MELSKETRNALETYRQAKTARQALNWEHQLRTDTATEDGRAEYKRLRSAELDAAEWLARALDVDARVSVMKGGA